MSINLKGRNFLTLKDFSKEEIIYLVDLAAKLKEKKSKGIFDKLLQNKNIALIFEKPSTRTRCAFVVACVDEGAHPEFLSSNDIQLGAKESIEDTARVLGRIFEGIQYRGFEQEKVEKLAKYSGVPVWNGLTDEDHPTQVLADLLTVKEKFGRLNDIKFVFIGDGRNNMANALMIGASKLGFDFAIAAPPALFPDKDLVKQCQEYANQSNGKITITDSMDEAVKGAHVIYTDVWVSMGEESQNMQRCVQLEPFRVTKAVMEKTGRDDTVFMHCLPAVKGNEVTEEVFESPASVVFDEAENRMHTIKAVMVATLADNSLVNYQ